MVKRRVYVTPELWNLVNKRNKELLELFIQECKQHKKTEATLRQYDSDLRIIFIYLLQFEKNKTITFLKRNDFRKMSIHFHERLKMSVARVNRLLSTVRSLLTYCEMDEEIDYENNACRTVKGLKKQKVRGKENEYFFIPHETILEMRDMLINKGKLMEATLLMVSYDSGCRRGEIIQVNKTNILENLKTNIVVGKGRKEFPLYFTKDTQNLIRKYLSVRGYPDIDELFVNSMGAPITYEMVYYVWKEKILKMYNRSKGTKLVCPFHALRHSRIDNLYTRGDERILDKDGNKVVFDLTTIQILVNHEDISTTSSYLQDRRTELLDSIFAA